MTTTDTLRRFNRAYTQRIGALDESFLGSGRPLGVARLLFEIGLAGDGGLAVADLRGRLGLDSGYLSRLLRALEGDDVVAVVADDADGRRRTVALTERGRGEWAELDRRSETRAADLVAALSARQRGRLTAALGEAERLIRVATLSIDHVDPHGPDAAAAQAAYFAELDERFEGGFDPGDTIVADAWHYEPPSGRFLVARSDAEVVACGALQRVDAHSADTAEIKRMWVAPAWRGEGIGWRMLAELERHAVLAGYTRVVLDTNATLTEAIAMYEACGYEPIERYNDNPYAERWFARSLETSP